jgi:hypothetical protein
VPEFRLGEREVQKRVGPARPLRVPRPDFRTLLIMTLIRLGGKLQWVSAIIDTGATASIIRSGLVDPLTLAPARRPRRFVGAGGESLVGGTLGLMATLGFKTSQEGAYTGETHRCKHWLYSADIKDDLILSYPFLVAHRFSITPCEGTMSGPSRNGMVTIPGESAPKDNVFSVADGPAEDEVPADELPPLVSDEPILSRDEALSLLGVDPVVDVFGKAEAGRFSEQWPLSGDPFCRHWDQPGVLWCEPAHDQVARVLAKVSADNALAVVALPLRGLSDSDSQLSSLSFLALDSAPFEAPDGPWKAWLVSGAVTPPGVPGPFAGGKRRRRLDPGRT